MAAGLVGCCTPASYSRQSRYRLSARLGYAPLPYVSTHNESYVPPLGAAGIDLHARSIHRWIHRPLMADAAAQLAVETEGDRCTLLVTVAFGTCR